MEDNLNQFLLDDAVYQTTLNVKFLRRKPYKSPDNRRINAFIPGTIREIFVANGQSVQKGAPLLILEAMKMKNKLMAPFDGKIKRIHVQTGQTVSNKQLLVEME